MSQPKRMRTALDVTEYTIYNDGIRLLISEVVSVLRTWISSGHRLWSDWSLGSRTSMATSVSKWMRISHIYVSWWAFISATQREGTGWNEEVQTYVVHDLGLLGVATVGILNWKIPSQTDYFAEPMGLYHISESSLVQKCIGAWGNGWQIVLVIW